MKVCVFNDMSYVTNKCTVINNPFKQLLLMYVFTTIDNAKESSEGFLSCYSNRTEFSSSQGTYSSNDVCEDVPSTHDNAEITEFL